jgi:hypothetical protein
LIAYLAKRPTAKAQATIAADCQHPAIGMKQGFHGRERFIEQ